MKKIVLTLSMALVFTTSALAAKVSLQRDTVKTGEDGKPVERLVVVDEGDTAVVIERNGAGSDVIARVKDLDRHLDDTILNFGDVDVDVDDVDPYDLNRAQENISRNVETIAGTVKKTLSFLGFCVVAIVGLCLLFYYLHRRRRYKTIEAAIAAGYPLPPEFFGRYSVPQPYAPAPSPDAAAPGAQPQQLQQPAVAPMPTDDYWISLRSGYRLVAVGIGLILFFLILEVPQMAAVMSIILFLGVGKIALAYQKRQSSGTRQQYYNAPYYGPQQPQQPQQEQQVETPPAFRYGDSDEAGDNSTQPQE